MEDTLVKPTLYDEDSYIQQDDNDNNIRVFGYGVINNPQNKKDKDVLKPVYFDRRNVRHDDILIEILYCGVCHSDWHVNLNEWNSTKYPAVTGHEITGRVVEVGKNVVKFKIDEFVAVSPTYNSCRTCVECQQGFEQYCEKGTTETYNMNDRLPTDIDRPTGPITYGGYSNYITINENYVLKVPDNMPLEYTAPILCAGVTTYNPLKYHKIGKGHKVGIAGIGGLGHMAIKFAKALGAEVIALTSSSSKKEDCLRFGAKDVVLISDKTHMDKYKSSLDFIIDTIPFKHDFDIYMNLLKSHGTLCIVGAFFKMETDFNCNIRKGRNIAASNTGGISDCQEVLNFCSVNNILPEINLISIDEINDTHENIKFGKVRYRYVIDMSTL